MLEHNVNAEQYGCRAVPDDVTFTTAVLNEPNRVTFVGAVVTHNNCDELFTMDICINNETCTSVLFEPNALGNTNE